jgi:hypothetical protein
VDADAIAQIDTVPLRIPFRAEAGEAGRPPVAAGAGNALDEGS